MSATKRQIEFIEKLQELGATIPCNDHDNPSAEMFESVANADKYIKQWGHLNLKNYTKLRPDEYGGVPNY